MICQSKNEQEFAAKLLSFLTKHSPSDMRECGLLDLDPFDVLLTMLAIDKLENMKEEPYVMFGFICGGLTKETYEAISPVLLRYFDGSSQCLLLVKESLFEFIAASPDAKRGESLAALHEGLEALVFKKPEQKEAAVDPINFFPIMLRNYSLENGRVFANVAPMLLKIIVELLDAEKSDRKIEPSLDIEDFLLVGTSDLDELVRGDLTTLMEKCIISANQCKNIPTFPQSPLMITLYLGRGGQGYSQEQVADFVKGTDALFELKNFFVRAILMRTNKTALEKPMTRQGMQELVANAFEIHLAPKFDSMDRATFENFKLLKETFCFASELNLQDKALAFFADDPETLEDLIFGGEDYTIKDINSPDLHRAICIREQNSLYKVDTITPNTFLSYHDLVTLEVDPINRLVLIKELIKPSAYSLYLIEDDALAHLDPEDLKKFLTNCKKRYLLKRCETQNAVLLAIDDKAELESKLQQFAIAYRLLIDRG